MAETIITLFIAKLSEGRPRGGPGVGIRKEDLKEGQVSTVWTTGKKGEGT